MPAQSRVPVTVNPLTDSPTYAGVTGMGGAITAARFVGTGTARRPVIVRWSTAPIVLTRVGGGATMRVENMSTNSGVLTISGSDPRIIPADRVLDIRFGGRLHVGASQQDGDYVGSFTVTVEYL